MQNTTAPIKQDTNNKQNWTQWVYKQFGAVMNNYWKGVIYIHKVEVRDIMDMKFWIRICEQFYISLYQTSEKNYINGSISSHTKITNLII